MLNCAHDHIASGSGPNEAAITHQETEAVLRSFANVLVETASDAIILADAQGTIILWNKAAQTLFGYSTEEVIGQSLTCLMPARYRDAHQKGLERVRAAGHSQLAGKAVELYGLKKDGAEFPLELSLGTWQSSGNIFFSGIIRDITERKRIGEQLIQAEKLASLGTLVSGMAHEVNNPAQGILGMAQIILSETDQQSIKEYAQDIVGYTKHIATVVRDFATYARRSDRDGEAAITLSERMTDAVKLVRRCPYFGDVDVVTDFQPVPVLQARRTEIDQVFVNLIGNAVQAMNGKGLLTLATALRGNMVTASVSDTGSGIPKDHLGKIFDPFFTTKDPGKGTGLGLYIVHKIVTKHRGQIQVESEVGKHTTFTVAFPVGHISPKEVSHETALA